MAIRFKDAASQVGAVAVTLAGAIAQVLGTFAPAPGRTGTIQSSLGTLEASLTGQFATGVTRTGFIAATLRDDTARFRDDAVVSAAFYPLELVAPRAAGTFPSADADTPAFPSDHFCSKYTTDMPYRYRAVVIGGALPYTFSLPSLGGATGMTIDPNTGVINWNTAGMSGNKTPTIRVVDALGAQIDAQWTITHNNGAYIYYDINAGNNANSGAIGSPRQTLAHARTNTAGLVLVLRGSSDPENPDVFDFTGIPKNQPEPSLTTKRLQWGHGRGTAAQVTVFPGEFVDFNHGYQAGVESGAMVEIEPGNGPPVYWYGVRCRNVDNGLTRLQVAQHVGGGVYHAANNYAQFDSVKFHDIMNPIGGANPGGMMFVSPDASNNNALRRYFSMQSPHARGLDNGQGTGIFKMYGTKKSLVEDLDIDGCKGPGDWKGRCLQFEGRRFRVRNATTHADMDFIGNMHGSDTTPSENANHGVVRFVLVDRRTFPGGLNASTPPMAARINQDGVAAKVELYRCTFIGQVNVTGVSTTGPFRFTNCVRIVRPSEISLPNAIVQVSPFDPSIVEVDGDLVGVEADGIVDSNGNLQGAYIASHRGTHGYEEV